MNSTDIIHLQHLLQAVSIVNRRVEGQRRQKYCASIDRLKNVTFDSHQFNIDSFMQEFGHHQSKSILSSCDCHDNKYEIKLTEYFNSNGFVHEKIYSKPITTSNKEIEYIDYNAHINSRLYCRYTLVESFHLVDDNFIPFQSLNYNYYMLAPAGLLTAVFIFKDRSRDAAYQVSKYIVNLLSKNNLKIFSAKLLPANLTHSDQQSNYNLCIFCKKIYKTIFVD